MTHPAVIDQAPPGKSDGEDVMELVVEDIQETDRSDWGALVDGIRRRKKMGYEEYGMILRTENGRSFLIDAYQEAIDLCVYLRGLIEELESKGEGAANDGVYLRDEYIAALNTANKLHNLVMSR